MATSTENDPSPSGVRRDLAACYRLIALFGWDDLIFTHVSARLPGEDDHFLINPYGMLFDEVRASDLVTVDLAGNVVGNCVHPVNPAGFTIHSAIHEARPDAHCVVHLHTDHGTAVAAQRDGLLPISQPALLAYPSLGYHDYEGLALRDAEKARLVADLGERSFLILRNHGTLAIGRSVAEAFVNIYFLERACTTQILAQSRGSGELTRISDPIIEGIAAQTVEVTKGLGAGLVWPGLLRKLDRIDPSYRD